MFSGSCNSGTNGTKNLDQFTKFKKQQTRTIQGLLKESHSSKSETSKFTKLNRRKNLTSIREKKYLHENTPIEPRKFWPRIRRAGNENDDLRTRVEVNVRE